jgi:hypothetical protein
MKLVFGLGFCFALFVALGTTVLSADLSTPKGSIQTGPAKETITYAQCIDNLRTACKQTKQFRATVAICVRWNRYRCR